MWIRKREGIGHRTYVIRRHISAFGIFLASLVLIAHVILLFQYTGDDNHLPYSLWLMILSKSILLSIALLLSQSLGLCFCFVFPEGVSVQCCFSTISSSLQNASPIIENEQSSTPKKVGIIGAGSVAFGTASLLSSLGHNPMIWSPSGAGTRELVEEAQSSSTTKKYARTSRIKANGAYQLMEQAPPVPETSITSTIQSTGALSQVFDVRIAQSTRDLVRSNDNILVVALPVNCHKDVFDRIVPDIIEWMDETDYIIRIIISSHASLGAVYAMQQLRKEWLSRTSASLSDFEDRIRITCWGTTAVTARKTSGVSVNVLTIRKQVDYCTVPFESDDDTNNILQMLFGARFKYRDGGLLAISLSNLNPQNHLGIVLGNMSRMDPPPPPPPLNDMPAVDTTKPETWFQGKSITPKVGRLMEALDLERINIAKVLDIDVRTIYEHFSWSFHVPLETPIETDEHNDSPEQMSTRPLTVSEMNQQMHYYKKNDVLGPTDPESRYVMEDVPVLTTTVLLGRLLHCPARLHESGIMILSAMYGRDFLVENELLKGLGLIDDDDLNINAFTLEEWQEMAYLGYFRKR